MHLNSLWSYFLHYTKLGPAIVERLHFYYWCKLSRILEQLGSGQFGEVFKALWTVDGKTLQLAVKTLISGASEDDKIKFLQEAAIMGQFSHPNVIKLYGVVTVGEPVSK